MKDYEMVVVVNVNFWPQIDFGSAIFQVEWMKMVVFSKGLEFLFGGSDDVRPAKGSEFDGFNHF